MFDKIKNIIASFFKVNFAIRFAILSFLGALGGSSYIGFISEFASYYYAWDLGFRIPAEGMTYLKLTVSALSFIAISLGVLVFSLVYFIGQLVLWYVYKSKFGINVLGVGVGVGIDFSDFLPALRIVTLKKILPIALIMSLISGVVGFVAPIYDETITINNYVLSLIAFVGMFFFIIILWNTKALLIFSGIFSLVVGVVIPNILFDSDTYAYLLRQLKYGGGIEVKISPSYSKSSESSESFKLLLRTSSSLILLNKTHEILEVPHTKINTISYGVAPKT
ncbi:hypothetical protein [Vibrio cortegadensis]|uniref:Uncharacterized protein n=1 Tax=Vibrio cortegadensis TaxID=1328770 RepID=A0ABV4MBF5_9VIBR